MAEPRVLLLTDVVDSTRLVERVGDDRAARIWASHDRLARDLLSSHGGREIDKTDGFLMLFDSVGSAVRYAMAYHTGLARLDPPLTARVGIHMGPVVLTENAPDDVARGAKPLEVDGIAKPTAARVMSVATGRQTLLTAAAMEALPPQVFRSVSHGFWRMKGRDAPIELFEVGPDDMTFTPPPDAEKVYRVVQADGIWIPVRAVPHSLPAERDAFCGRRDAIAQLAGCFEDGSRLVTLLGPGGVGKTRVACRYGWSWLGEFPGGVWFCDLAEARTLDGLLASVAAGLDLPLGGPDPRRRILDALRTRGPTLLILDNFEQITALAEATIGHWLDHAPDTHVLVTSREVLSLPGERIVPLGPMAQREAVEMFEARARAAQHSFSMTTDVRRHVEALVALLDRLPLAIELAAARIRVMSPETMLGRMSQRFRLLAGRGQHRQATLKATLDWSWDLLTPAEQTALAQLSVFDGGFTLDGAEAVVRLDDPHAPWATDLVQSLVDKSLVRRESDDRFDLLVSVKDYATMRLAEQQGVDGAYARHGAHYASIEETALRRAGPRERPNFLAALRRAIDRQDWTVGLTVAASVADSLAMHGSHEGAVVDLGRLAAAQALSSEQRARAGLMLARATEPSTEPVETRRRLEEALAAARQAEATAVEAEALARLGASWILTGDLVEARASLEAALVAARKAGTTRVEGMALSQLAMVDAEEGRAEGARDRLLQAIALRQQAHDQAGELTDWEGIGIFHARRGELTEALDAFHRAWAIATDIGQAQAIATAQLNIGNVQNAMGQREAARSAFEDCLVQFRKLGQRRLLAYTHSNLARLYTRADEWERARHHVSHSADLLDELGSPAQRGGERALMSLLAARRGQQQRAADLDREASGLLQGSQDRWTVAEALALLGQSRAVRGDRTGAEEALQRCSQLAAELQAGPDSLLAADLQRIRNELQAGDTAAPVPPA